MFPSKAVLNSTFLIYHVNLKKQIQTLSKCTFCIHSCFFIKKIRFNPFFLKYNMVKSIFLQQKSVSGSICFLSFLAELAWSHSVCHTE